MSLSWADQLGEVLFDDVEVGSTGFGDTTVQVRKTVWVPTLRLLRSEAGLEYFDWLSAVHETDGGFNVYCHLYAPATHRRALVSAALPVGDASIESERGP